MIRMSYTGISSGEVGPARGLLIHSAMIFNMLSNGPAKARNRIDWEETCFPILGRRIARSVDGVRVMNFRDRYLVIAIRILLGLIMLASGISGLLMGNSTQGVPAKMVAFTQVFWASGIFQMVKVTEIVAGFMLLIGIFPALATLFLAPDVVGIVIVNARLMPSFLWLGAVVFVLTAYLGYAYWDRYKSIFSRN